MFHNHRTWAFFIICLSLLITHPGLLTAETHVSGEVQGHWTAAGSPYIADNSIYVPAGAILEIDENVEVLFYDDDSLIVYGKLYTHIPAVSRVRFAHYAGVPKTWRGIFFVGLAASESVLQFSLIENTSHGVNCTNSNPLIVFNSINSKFWGFNSYISYPIFEFDTISIDYESTVPCVVIGAKLDGYEADMVFQHNIIDVKSMNISNDVSAFGINSSNSNLVIRNNRIWVWAKGKSIGIFLSDAEKDSILNNEIVCVSQASYVKAGISIFNCSGTVILNNTIDVIGPNNDTGLLFQNGSYAFDVINNIVKGDYTSRGIVGVSSEPNLVSYNDFFAHSIISLGIPELDSTNIYDDPLFYNIAPDSIYYLSRESPCIDAGHPEIFDPDLTVSDMGAYYYPHPPTGLNSGCNLPETIDLIACYPNPTNGAANIRLNLTQDDYITIRVFDIIGRLSGEVYCGDLSQGVYLFNWNEPQVTSGIYFIEAVSSHQTQVSKLILMK
jgi:hypothetical protein